MSIFSEYCFVQIIYLKLGLVGFFFASMNLVGVQGISRVLDKISDYCGYYIHLIFLSVKKKFREGFFFECEYFLQKKKYYTLESLQL